MKLNSQKTAVLALVVLLAAAVVYIAFDAHNDSVQREALENQQEQIGIFQQGMQSGYEQAVTQLFQQAITCQAVPVTYQNQTINVVAVECLQQAEAGQ